MALFENFPYTNIHELNLDWIVKIAKDFLEQYTHIQQLISDGETSLTNLTESGLASLQEKADALEAALQAWYDTHSEDIANQLADALADLNAWYTEHQGYLDQYLTDSVAEFGRQAEQKARETIATIPADYTEVSNTVTRMNQSFGNDRAFRDEDCLSSVPTANSDDLLAIGDKNGNAIVKIDRFGNLKTPNFDNTKLNMQLIPFSSIFDLGITDPDGNMLLAVRNGDIITSKLAGKKVSILGDSISTYAGYIPSGYVTHYPTGNVNDVNKTWWKKLIDETGMQLVTNASWAGSRVTGDSTGNAYAGCSTSRINDLSGENGEIPDIILVYIGTNDWGNPPQREIGTFDSTREIPAEGTITTISDAYALMLYKIRTTYPLARVFCITSLEGRHTAGDTSYPILNSHNQTIFQMDEAIKNIAHIFGASVIDLTTCGIHYWNVATYTVDGTVHPNTEGMTIIKNKIMECLLHDYVNNN